MPPLPTPPSAAARLVHRALLRVRPIGLASALKRLLGVRRHYLRAKNGAVYWIDPVSNLGAFLTERGEYEPELERGLREFLLPGGTFLDIGANEGYFTVAAARLVGGTGAVHAFEPQQRLQEALAANVCANGPEGLRLQQSPAGADWAGAEYARLSVPPGARGIAAVSIHNLGLGAEAGMAELHLTADVNTGASSFRRRWKVGAGTQPFALATLDAFIRANGIERVHLAKVDCEGGEIGLLAGAAETLAAQRVDRFLIEFHPHIVGAESVAQAEARLAAAGYAKRTWGTFALFESARVRAES